MFGKLSSFKTKIKLSSSRGLTGSHELAMFLDELPGDAEKGLSQRFRWFFPKPAYSLEPADKA